MAARANKHECRRCKITYDSGEIRELRDTCDELMCPLFVDDVNFVKDVVASEDTFNKEEISEQPKEDNKYLKPRVKMVYDYPPISGHIDRRHFK